MAGRIEPARLPGALLQGRVSGQAPLAPVDVIARVTTGDIELEGFRPLPLNLEWRLSALHWLCAGVTPFITDDVPYLVNNDGRASADAAAVLFANCVESPGDGLIRALEIGAGTALFARFFLDEFRALCGRHGEDFYDRLALHVTDASAASVATWAANGIFAEHQGHVFTAVCDAQNPGPALGRFADGPLRAVFANYVLDSLPAAVLHWHDGGWQQLCARASIRRDTPLPPSLSNRDAEWMRRTASSANAEELTELLPLLPFLESGLAFRTVDGDGPPDFERHLAAGTAVTGPVIYSYGALRCLDALVPHLDRDGFALVRDHTAESSGPRFVGAQRFGGAAAMPVNFAVIERHLQRLGVEVVRPQREGLMHTRLLVTAPIAGTRAAFAERFSAVGDVSGRRVPEVAARECASQGLHQEALTIYQQALAESPRDWRLLASAAQFVGSTLGDHASGIDLACAALRLNPWYSPSLWNTLGECLRAVGREDEAHDCHREAVRIHPGSAETWVHIARSWLTRGDVARALDAVAKGLTTDVDSMHRHVLLDLQTTAIEQLSRAGMARREAAHRRQARGAALAATVAVPEHS